MSRALSEASNSAIVPPETFPDAFDAAIPYLKQDDLGGRSEDHGQVLKILVLGDNGESVGFRELPNCVIGSTVQSDCLNVSGPWKQVCKLLNEPARQILIEQQLQITLTFSGYVAKKS
jgi:hypothetical protein